MEVKTDSRIREIYENMMEPMTRLVQNPRDAFSIIWFDIHGYLEPEHSAMKADLCGLMTKKITGVNIGSQVHVPVRDNTPYYQMVQKEYAFGARIGELGDYWKELIISENYFDLGILNACLNTYYKEIMPYVKSEIVTWYVEVLREHTELSPTLKPYKAHRAKIKAAKQVIDTASDVLMLKKLGIEGTQQDDYSPVL